MILEGTKDPIMIYSNNNYLYTIDNTIMLWFSGFNRKIGNYEYNLYDISDNTLVYFNKSKLYIIDFLNNKTWQKLSNRKQSNKFNYYRWKYLLC